MLYVCHMYVILYYMFVNQIYLLDFFNMNSYGGKITKYKLKNAKKITSFCTYDFFLLRVIKILKIPSLNLLYML